MAMEMIPMNIVSTLQCAGGPAAAAGSTAAAAAALRSGIQGGEELPGQSGSFVALLKALLSGEKGVLSVLPYGQTMEKNGETALPDSLSEELGQSGETALGGDIALLLHQLMAQMQGAGAALPPVQVPASPGMSGEPVHEGDLSGGGNVLMAIQEQAGATPAKRMHTQGAFPPEETGLNVVQGEAAATGNGYALRSETSVSPPGTEESGTMRYEPGAARDALFEQYVLPDDTELPLKVDSSAFQVKESLVLPREMQAREGDSHGVSLPAGALKMENDTAPADTDASSPAAVSFSAALPAETRGKGDLTTREALPLHRVNELGEAAAKAAEAGTRNLIVKLDPPDLGSIQIKLRIENGVLTADIRVESSAVKEMLSLAVPQIRSSLEDSGIRVGEMWVDHKEDSYSDGRDRQGSADQQRGRQQKQDREEHPRFFEYFA